MKRFFNLLLILLFPLASLAFGPGDDIIKAFQSGNATNIAKFFDTNIDLQILSKDSTYSKSQAEQLLKSFFSNNSVSSFKVLHKVNSANDSSESIVGQMMSGGKSYRVHILIGKSGASKVIQELSIRQR